MKLDFTFRELCHNSPSHPPESKIKLLEYAKLIDVSCNGNLFADRFSCLNRVIFDKYLGVGCFSYLCDTTLSRFNHIGARCSIGGFNHPINWLSTSSFQYSDTTHSWGETLRNVHKYNPDRKGVILNSDIWVGDNSTILAGIELATGTIVAAGAVVTKNTEPYQIVAGSPAQVIRYRFNQKTIERLLQSQWWEKDLKDLEGINFSNIEAALEMLNF